MSTTFEIKLEKLNNLNKNLSNGTILKVGFLDKEYAKIAIIQNYGAVIQVTPKMKKWFLYKHNVKKSNNPIIIPARPFMNDTFKENREKWSNILIKLLAIKNSKDALSILGEKITADIKRKISHNEYIDNAPFTVMVKGRNQPLIDTGGMLKSVAYEVN